MDVIEYLKEKIKKVSDNRITFREGGYCKKNADGVIDWANKNYVTLVRDITEEATKGPDYINETIRERFRELLPVEKAIKSIKIDVDVEGAISDDDVRKHIDNLVPVLNAQGNDKKNLFLMLNPQNDYRISNVKYSVWEVLQDPDYVKAMIRQARTVMLRYVPTTTSNFLPMREDDEPLFYLNTYIPPKHRLEPITEPKIPKMVVEFLRRLFVNKKCYEFMMESIWYMLNDRLQVIPVLNGGTGIGKGLFTEYLLSGLVGIGNAIVAPASWDKSGFNAWLLKKQLIVFDEAKIISAGPDSNIDYLKRLMNDSLNVERKGVDADTLTENHASFFITSNNGAKRFRLELDNRRFAPIDVTDQKVESVYKDKKDRDRLVELLQDKDVIANIYWEIQNNWNPEKRNPERTPHTILQCESLYKFQYESLTPWQLAVAELILSKESDEYMAGEINANYRKVYTRITGRETNTKRSVNKSDVKDFLQSYRYYGELKPMGHVKDGEDGEMVIVAAEKYKSEHSGYKEVGLNAL